MLCNSHEVVYIDGKKVYLQCLSYACEQTQSLNTKR